MTGHKSSEYWLEEIWRILSGTLGGSSTPATTPSSLYDNHLPAVNTSAIVTYGAQPGKKHYLHEIVWSYNADPTTVGTLKVTDAGVTVFGAHYITKGGPGFILFDPPLTSVAENTAMTITLTTGGAAVTGVVTGRHKVK